MRQRRKIIRDTEMFLLANILIVVVTAAVVARGIGTVNYRFGKCAFFASYGLIFGLAPLMQSKTADVHAFGESARTVAAIYALAGLFMLLVGFQLTEWPTHRLAVPAGLLRKHLALPKNQHLLIYVFWISIAMTAASQLLMMYSKGITLDDLLNSWRFEFRFNNPGFLTVLALHLTTFAYAPAFIGLFLNRRYQILTLVYMCITGATFYCIYSKGTRSIPLAMIVTFLVAASIRYTFSRRHVICVCGVGVTCLMLAIGLGVSRQYQTSLSLLDQIQILFTPETYQEMWDNDPLNYSTQLVGAIAVFPDQHPYLWGATYRRMPVFFLKESQFPGLKPPDTNILFGLVVHGCPEEVQVTVPPSILGDVYINFWGWLGLPFLCLHGMLYAWLLRSMQTSLFGFLSIGPLSGRFLVLVHRGEPYEMFVSFVMFWMLMGAVYCLCRSISVLSPAHNQELLPRHRPRHTGCDTMAPLIPVAGQTTRSVTSTGTGGASPFGRGPTMAQQRSDPNARYVPGVSR